MRFLSTLLVLLFAALPAFAHGYRFKGTVFPGEYLTVRLQEAQNVVATPAAGGSLPVSVDHGGNTTKGSAEATCVVSGANDLCELTWDNVAAAASYRIYKGASAGGQDRYQTSSVPMYDYDTDSGATLGSVPASNTSILAQVGNTGGYFLTVKIVSGAGLGKLLMSDADGDGSWEGGTPADDNAFIFNGTTWQSKLLPDCDAANNFIQYDQATNAFSCTATSGGSSHNLLSATHTDTTAASATDNQVIVSDANAWESKTLPSCSDATMSKLLYNNSTQAFSCGTDQTSGSSDYVKVTNSGNVSTNDQTWTSMTWDTEAWDTNSMHSTVSNTDRITIQTSGKYLIHCKINFNTPVTGTVRASRVFLNGTTQIGVQFIGPNATFGQPVLTIVERELSATDYITCDGWQDRGGTLDMLSHDSTYFSARLIP